MHTRISRGFVQESNSHYDRARLRLKSTARRGQLSVEKFHSSVSGQKVATGGLSYPDQAAPWAAIRMPNSKLFPLPFCGERLQLEVHTASTDQDLASDEIRQRRTEEQDSTGGLFWRTEASQGTRSFHRIQHTLLDSETDLVAMHLQLGGVILQGLHEPGLNQAKADGVHIHVVPSPLLGHGFRQADHARLTRRITGLSRVAVGSSDGSNIYDLAHHPQILGSFAFGRFPNVFGSRAQNPERRHEMNFQHGFELLVRRFLDDAVPAIPRVVDNDVNGTKGP